MTNICKLFNDPLNRACQSIFNLNWFNIRNKLYKIFLPNLLTLGNIYIRINVGFINKGIFVVLNNKLLLLYSPSLFDKYDD